MISTDLSSFSFHFPFCPTIAPLVMVTDSKLIGKLPFSFQFLKLQFAKCKIPSELDAERWRCVYGWCLSLICSKMLNLFTKFFSKIDPDMMFCNLFPPLYWKEIWDILCWNEPNIMFLIKILFISSIFIKYLLSKTHNINLIIKQIKSSIKIVGIWISILLLK